MQDNGDSAPETSTSGIRVRKSENPTTRDASATDSRVYTNSANRRNQKKTTDLIPKRFLSCALVVLVLVAAIAGLNLLANYSGHWYQAIGDAGVQATSLGGAGSLSNWFKSFLLIITGLASLQIYALRQHRCDDYRGTYRLWIWMSALFFLASVNCVVDLRQIAINLSESFFSTPVSNRIWTLAIIKIIALSALVVRGLIEVRQCRSALGLIVLVWFAWSAAAVMQIPAVHQSLVLEHDVTCGNLVLFGTAALFLSHLLYARYVFLTAQGLIVPVVRKQKTKLKKKKKKRVVAAQSSTKKSAASTSTSRADSSATDSQATETARKPKSKRRKKKVASESSDMATAAPVLSAPVRPPVPKPTRSLEPESQEVPMKTRAEIRDDRADSRDNETDEQQILSLVSDGKRKLTKSERKRLQKQQKNNRRAA